MTFKEFKELLELEFKGAEVGVSEDTKMKDLDLDSLEFIELHMLLCKGLNIDERVINDFDFNKSVGAFCEYLNQAR